MALTMPRPAPNPGGNPTYPGPRLYGRGKPKPGGTADIVDPARGEPVPRCRICGLPASDTTRLLQGTWAIGTFRMGLVLCERELPPFDPRFGDPLSALG